MDLHSNLHISFGLDDDDEKDIGNKAKKKEREKRGKVMGRVIFYLN